MIHELRIAWRTLMAQRGFTFVAVTILALGIGSTVAVFSVVRPLLAEVPGLEEPESLVAVYAANPNRGRDAVVTSLPDLLDLGERSTTLGEVTARQSVTFNLAGTNQPVRIAGSRILPNYFSLLGLQPILGRSLSEDDAQPGAEAVALLSEATWQSSFGADPGVIGRQITLDGQPAVVVGVMASDRAVPCCGVFVPLEPDPQSMGRGERSLFALGRLATGATRGASEAELQSLAADLEREHPVTNAGWSVRLAPIEEQYLGPAAAVALGVLSVAVLLVLAIACANIANLLLARSSGRQREMQVRAALGAQAWRIARQLFVEGLLLGGLGGAVGLALGVAGAKILQQSFGLRPPNETTSLLDPAALVFAIAVSALAGLSFSMAPAFHTVRASLTSVASFGARAVQTSRSRLPRVIVAAEVALALVLLVVAGLLLRTVANMVAVEPGFDPSHLATLRVTLPAPADSPGPSLQFFDDVRRRASSLVEVRQAGWTSRLPMAGGRNNATRALIFEGRPQESGADAPWAVDLVVSPDYLEALGLPRLSGRPLRESDRETSERVALISETLERKHFTEGGAVGARFRFADETSWTRIVGVVADVRNDDVDQPPLPQVYLPMRQNPRSSMSLLVRTQSDPEAAAGAIREVVRDVDPNLPVYEIRSMDEILHLDTRGSQIIVNVLSAFALLALCLAAVGIYGVVAYDTVRRTHEVGVRITFGARRADIVRLVVLRAMVPVILGGTLGLGAALGLGRLLRGMLFGVGPADPATLLGVVTLLLGSAAVAAALPALRAAGQDAVTSLRS